MQTETIVCPWCGTVYQEYRPNCMNCGGALPHRDRQSAGDPPPPPPRQLPKEFVRRARRSSQFELIFGGIFAGIGTFLGVVFTLVGTGSGLWVFLLIAPINLLVFGGIGFGVLFWGRWRSSRLIQVLTHGVVAEGVIDDVEIDNTIHVNGRSPWQVRYSFMSNDVWYNGSQHAWQRDATLQPGIRVHVVYLPQDPIVSSVYPPMA